MTACRTDDWEQPRSAGWQPAWDDVGLAIAREIASGATTIYVKIEAGDSPDVAVGILAGWQQVVPGVRLQLRDEAAQEGGVQLRRQEAQKLISLGRELLETGGSQTLHEAIKAYVASVKLNPQYLISDKTRLIDWGKVKIDLIEFCADHMPDVRLSDLKMQKINELLNILRCASPEENAGRCSNDDSDLQKVRLDGGQGVPTVSELAPRSGGVLLGEAARLRRQERTRAGGYL